MEGTTCRSSFNMEEIADPTESVRRQFSVTCLRDLFGTVNNGVVIDFVKDVRFVNNKLHAIYQTVGTAGHNKGLSRHESVIINRLRIGHTRFTHSYLLSGDDQPTCSTCGHPLTVRHILLDCVDLQDVRRKHFSVTSFRDLFETVDNRVVIDFIKDIRFYSLL